MSDQENVAELENEDYPSETRGEIEKVKIQYFEMNSNFIDTFALWALQNDKFVFTDVNDEESFINVNLEEPLAIISNKEKYIIIKNILVICGDDNYLIFYDNKERMLMSAHTSENIAKNHEYELVMKIADFIAKLPSDESRSMAFTNSLRTVCEIQRRHNKMISIYFLQVCFKNENFKILFKQLDEFNHWHKKIVNVNLSIAYLYNSLWNLLSLVFPCIKKDLKKHCLQREEMFMNIIKDAEDSKYLRLLEEDYLEFLRHETVKNQKEFSNKWLDLIFQYTKTLIEKDNQDAKQLIGRYQSDWINLERAVKELFEARTKNGMLIPSVIWKNQICFIVDKNNKPSIQPFE